MQLVISSPVSGILWVLIAAHPAAAQSNVAATVHNLSVTGPGAIRAVSETEVCKFCHIPHSPAMPEPLWGHAMSVGQPYSVSTGAPSPDAGSLLCLSCHDGTVALGDVAGTPQRIALAQQYLGPGDAGFLGIDLSGHHPISFVVPQTDPFAGDLSRDMGLRPLTAIQADPDVRLDPNGRMQCSTCHDPHSDRYYRPGTVPRFWVKPTVEDTCLACHEVR